MADVLFRFLIGLRSIASQDLAIQLSFYVFRRFIVLVFTTIYKHLKPRLQIYGKSIGVLMGTAQCGDAILGVNLAAGRQWETCEVSLALSGKHFFSLLHFKTFAWILLMTYWLFKT